MSSFLLQLPSTSGANTTLADNNEEYKMKIEELKKYVEPLKKKLENTDPSQNRKLQKLLELITNPNKKISLTVLVHCEKALQKCIPGR